MIKALPATVLLIAAVIAVIWMATWLVHHVPLWWRERRSVKADEHATWRPYRRVDKQGRWEIGCERRWKKTTLHTLPVTAPLPLNTDIDELLRLEGEAIENAIRLNGDATL